MTIVKALDLSTSHVPGPEPDFGQIRFVAHEYGFILFVGEGLEVPDWIKKIWYFAVESACVLINFDSDAPEDPEFEIFTERWSP